MTLCTFSDRCLWPEFLYFTDSLHNAQHSWDTKNSRVCKHENFNLCFYKVIKPSSSQGVSHHGRLQYEFKSSCPEGFKLENEVQRPLLKLGSRLWNTDPFNPLYIFSSHTIGIIIIFYLYGYARSCNLLCVDPLYSYLLIPEERRKTIWSELESNLSPLSSQETVLTSLGNIMDQWKSKFKRALTKIIFALQPQSCKSLW